MAGHFRLSIWRPARLVRAVDYPVNININNTFTFQPDHLQEQIYVWDAGDNDVFSALDKDLSEDFRLLLLDKFAPSLAPEKRDVFLLKQVVNELSLKLQKSETTPWAYTGQTVRYGESNEANLRFNGPLALLNHLLWIVKVFGHVPGVSVTIR